MARVSLLKWFMIYPGTIPLLIIPVLLAIGYFGQFPKGKAPFLVGNLLANFTSTKGSLKLSWVPNLFKAD